LVALERAEESVRKAQQAKEVLSQRGLSYTETDLTFDAAGRQEMAEVCRGSCRPPLIVIEGQSKSGLESDYSDWVDHRIRLYRKAQFRATCTQTFCVLCDYL
jgi:glutaredoxin